MIEEENLQQNSLQVGTHLLKGFATLRDKYDLIGDVRGKVSKFNLDLILLRSSFFIAWCYWWWNFVVAAARDIDIIIIVWLNISIKHWIIEGSIKVFDALVSAEM